MNEFKRPARVLIIAGSDSGGGAGIQADIKAVTALGGFATTAITALTAQNTLEVRDVLPVPPVFIETQMRVVLEDIGADCLKTGMLHDAGVIEAVASTIETLAPDVPFVLDPVMVSETGARLLEAEAVFALRERLIPMATIITPNLPEAEVLLGRAIDTDTAMMDAARELAARSDVAVLLKGGHRRGATVRDVLARGDELQVFEHPRVETRSTHGTGCTLAAAIATGLAQGLPLTQAVDRGRRYLRIALEQAVPIGAGHGPVCHGHTVQPFP